MIRRAKEEDINGINRLLFQVQQIHAERSIPMMKF